jgi:hypothetical protein
MSLTNEERRILAMALNRFAMEHGPAFFQKCADIAKKVGVEKEVREALELWIKYCKKRTI